jgi:hypothetical protein
VLLATQRVRLPGTTAVRNFQNRPCFVTKCVYTIIPQFKISIVPQSTHMAWLIVQEISSVSRFQCVKPLSRPSSVVLRECPECIRAYPSEVGIARTTDLTESRVPP